MKVLNEEDVTVLERIRVVQSCLEGEKCERKINKLLFKEEELEDPSTISILSLPRVDFRSIYGFERFTNLTALDLSHNSITSLSSLCKGNSNTCIIVSLSKLQYLDLRYNILDSLEETITILSQTVQLNHLYLMDSTQKSSDTRNPFSYCNYVFEKIQTLRYLDGLLNPFKCKLASNQCIFSSSPVLIYNNLQ